MIEEREIDWLEGDVEQRKQDMRAKEIEFAKLYEVFVNTAQGRELLEFWEKTRLDIKTPVESSLQRYANDEAVREFLRNIRRQIRIAQEPF